MSVISEARLVSWRHFFSTPGRFLSGSIRLKLICGVAIVHLILMTSFVTDLVTRQKAFLLQAAKTRAVNDARLIADTASSWVIADDLVGMEEVLTSSARKGNNLRYAMIVDPGGRVLAHTERDKIGMFLTDAVSRRVLSGRLVARLVGVDSSMIYAVAPIEVDNHNLGWAMLGLDTTATSAHLAYVTRAGIVYTFGAIIVGTLFAILLARSILRQLSLVLKGTDRLAHNVLDDPIPIIRKDEVGTVAIALNNAASEIRKAQTRLETEMQERGKAEQDIRQLSHRLIHIIEDERKRIAQDLHDEFGQVLTAVQFNLKRLENAVPESLASVKEQCKDLVVTIERMGHNIDTIASDLRPAILDHLGLIAAVKSHVEELEKRRLGMQFVFRAVGFKKRLEPEIELACYRVIQESLTNVLKHANATRVDILLTMSYPKLILVIKDNGRGFDYYDPARKLAAEPRGIGLLGMKERVGAVGGTFEIRRQKPAGSVTRVELPAGLSTS